MLILYNLRIKDFNAIITSLLSQNQLLPLHGAANKCKRLKKSAYIF